MKYWCTDEVRDGQASFGNTGAAMGGSTEKCDCSEVKGAIIKTSKINYN